MAMPILSGNPLAPQKSVVGRLQGVLLVVNINPTAPLHFTQVATESVFPKVTL